MSLVEAISLNIAKEEIKINCEKDPESLYSRVPQEALQTASPMNGGCGSIKGGSL